MPYSWFKRRLAGVICGLLATPLLARASEDDLDTALDRLESRAQVRVRTCDRLIYEGRLFGTNDRFLFLTGDEGDADIPLADIQEMWVRGNASTTGFAAGAVAGAVMGIALVNFMANQGYDGSGLSTTGAIGVSLASALLVGTAGAVLASPFPAWHTVYQDPGVPTEPAMQLLR